MIKSIIYGFLLVSSSLVYCENKSSLTLKKEEAPTWEKVINHLSSYEKEILEIFFRTLLESSSGAYVLFSQKPVCMEGIPTALTDIRINLNYQGCILEEGMRIWESLAEFHKQTDYYIRTSEKANAAGWIEFILINKKKFLEVVKRDLPLFQYVLGPDVTPDALLLRIQKSKEELASILRYDKVLIGIVLGFSTQNSLFVGREENLRDYLENTKEELPLRAIKDRKCYFLKNLKMEKDWPRERKLQRFTPSFNHTSLQNEMDSFSRQIGYTWAIVQNFKPSIPIFGYVKCIETNHLLSNYLSDQKKIANVLNSPCLLEKVLAKILDEEDTFNIFSSHFLKSPNESRVNPIETYLKSLLKKKKNLGFLLGSTIRKELDEINPNIIKQFIKGMQAYEKKQTIACSNEELSVLNDKFCKYQRAYNAQKNLNLAKMFIREVKKQKGVTCLEKDKLYFKLLKVGSGDKIYGSDAVITLKITTYDREGNVLQHDNFFTISALELIPGLELGLQNMRQGDIGEFYIHPEYAYADSSQFEPNLALQIKVEVISVIAKGQEKYPVHPYPITPNSMSETWLENEIQKAYNEYIFQLGANIWAHFGKVKDLYNLEQVIEGIQSNEMADNPREDRQFLVKLQWLLYHS